MIVANINIQERIGDMIEDETLTNEPKKKQEPNVSTADESEREKSREENETQWKRI